MNPLVIEAKNDTPSIRFNAESGELELIGRSLPENAAAFYEAINLWVKEYAEKPSAKTKIKFHFDYISTSSAKQLMQLFITINSLSAKNKVEIIWAYDKGDTDMLQTGNRLQKLCNVTFEYQEALI